MKFVEVTGNLFDTDAYTKEDVVFAHCIASDFGMYGGIATQFIKHFDMKTKLLEWSEINSISTSNCSNCYSSPFVKINVLTRPSLIGKAVKIDNTYNLITKELTGSLPTLKTLESALVDLKVQMSNNDEHYLAIPDMIGCGIDRLDRNQVIGIIRSVFLFSDITVYAVKLKDIL